MSQKHLNFLVFTVNKCRLNQLMELIFSPMEKLQKNRTTSPFSFLVFILLSASPASACMRNAWRIVSFLGLGRSSRLCITKRFLDEAAAAAPTTTLGEIMAIL